MAGYYEEATEKEIATVTNFLEIHPLSRSTEIIEGTGLSFGKVSYSLDKLSERGLLDQISNSEIKFFLKSADKPSFRSSLPS